MGNSFGIESNFLESGKQVINPDYGAQVQIDLLRPNSMVLVGAWPNSLELVTTKLKSVCGIQPDSTPGCGVISKESIIACLTPGRFLLLSEASDIFEKLNDLMMPNASTVLDLSHSRIGYRISGPAVSRVLAKGLAIDTDESMFPALSVTQSTIDHVSVLIICIKPGVFDLYVPSSFAQSIAHWLTDASLEYGYSVGEFVKVN